MALAFASAGMCVVVVDVEGEAARAVADEVAERGARALAQEVDVADRAAMLALADKVYAELGAVHLLCNNAGIATGGPVPEVTDDDWGWVLAVNLHGVIHGLQASRRTPRRSSRSSASRSRFATTSSRSASASGRNRPERFGGPKPRVEGAGQAMRERGMDPLDVGRAVRDAVLRNDPYILTHPQARASVATRFDEILRAFDTAAKTE